MKAGFVKRTGGILHFLASLVLILGLGYVLGRTLLVEPIGNDGPHQLSYLDWLSHYFPEIPNWFPEAGGGYSVWRAYPISGQWLLAGLNRMTAVPTIELFHLSGFMAVIATAVGIYILCWGMLKNQTLGTIAAVFFLLSPISWFYIFEHGYISTAFATAAVPFALLAFDRLLEAMLEGRSSSSTRLWFAAFVCLLASSTMMHIEGGAAIGLVVTFDVFLRTARAGRAALWQVLRTGVKALVLTGGTVAFLLAFWLVPLYLYSSVANAGGQILAAPEAVAEHKQYLDEIISLTPAGVVKWAANASFPTVIAILAGVSALLSWPFDRKGSRASWIAVLTVLCASWTQAKVAVSYLGPFFALLFAERSLLIGATVLIPIGGAVGAWTIARLTVTPLAWLWARVSSIGELGLVFRKPVVRVANSLVALAVASGGVFLGRALSSAGPEYLNYGIERLRGVNVWDIWRTGQDHPSLFDQLQPGNWPRFEVAKTDEAVSEAIRVLSLLPAEGPVRIHISPYIGRLAQNMVVYTGDTQLAIYTVSADLIKSMQGFLGNVLFSREPVGAEFGTPRVLNELAKWFGIEYVYLQPEMDQSELYDAAGWDIIARDHYGGMPIELWHFPGATTLATLSSRPSILAIGRQDIHAYESVFRVGTRGGIPYDEAWVLEGDLPVDEYSLTELERFDAVFLQGYTYRNGGRAWDLLEQYVRQGGSLYVDTGWQWTVPEWEFEAAPSVLPVSRLRWTNFGLSDDYQLNSPDVSGDLDPSKFAPLEWEGQPWGVSGANQEDVRNWGKVVLSVAGQPLIVAGQYGEGRVVWSGMNLVAHSYDKDNQEEVDLLHSLISWLTAGKGSGDYPAIVDRADPDRVGFHASVPAGKRMTLYWREAYYPAWHAYSVSVDGSRQRLPIYRGGPGLMLIPIQTGSQSLFIDLVWETPLTEKLAGLISLLTLGALSAYVLDGLFLRGKAFTALKDRLPLVRRRSLPQGSVEWLNDAVSRQSEVHDSAREADAAPLAGIRSPSIENESGVTGIASPNDERGGQDVEVEGMWQEYVASVRTTTEQEDGTEELVDWWRRSRPGNTSESNED